MQIKDYIKNNLFTKTGKINTAIIRRDGFQKSQSYQIILDQTKNINGSVSERIYCILNDINQPVKCDGCHQKYVRFRTFQDGYEQFCSQTCARKVKPWKSSSKTKKQNYQQCVSNFLQDYNNKNYLTISNPDLKTWIQKRINEKRANLVYTNDLKQNRDVLCSVLERTAYLQTSENLNWSERFYHVLHDLNGLVTNKYNPDQLATYENINVGYRHNYNSNWLGYVQNEVQKQNFELCKNEEFKTANQSKIQLKCRECGNFMEKDLSDGKWQNVFCHFCYGDPNSSRQEKEIAEYIRSIYPGEVVENFLLEGKELDIYLPERGIAFEYHGLIWHSFGTCFPSNADLESKEKNKLYEKTLLFKNHNIRIYHIFSHEWEREQSKTIWKSIIKNALGLSNKIFARNCQIREINCSTKNDFLFHNHIQGIDHAKIALGLYHNDELVGVMTFNKPRFTKKQDMDYELIRFCNKKDTSIVGGASKLLSFFEQIYHPRGIVSYADLRRSDGNLYNKLGFVLNHCSEPNYFYFKANRIIKRYRAQKKNLQNILKEGFDPSLSESINMFKNNYRRVWDCGNMVFYKSYPKY